MSRDLVQLRPPSAMGRHAPDEDFLARIHARARLALDNVIATRTSLCGSCSSLAHSSASTCGSRASSSPMAELFHEDELLQHGFDGASAVCKHAATDARDRENRSAVTERRRRLDSAGCGDTLLVQLCEAGSLPRPRRELFDDDLQHRRHLDTLEDAERLAQHIAHDKRRALTGSGDEVVIRRLIVFAGMTGCGKSLRAALSVAHAPKPAVWLPASAVRVAEWDDLYARARDSYLLVIDDLGTEAQNDWARTQLANLILERLNAGRWTIVTTNVDRQRFLAYGGERLASRFATSGLYRQVVGPDFRTVSSRAA